MRTAVVLDSTQTLVFTKEQRQHRLVAAGGQTGGAPGQHAAQLAGVWQQRLPHGLVDSVPVARGHEAHEVRACASTEPRSELPKGASAACGAAGAP